VRIVFTTPYYPPHIGGIEIHVKYLSSFLSKRHDVKIISSTGSSSEGVEVLTPRCLNLPYSPIPFSFPNVKADVYHSHIPSPFFARMVDKKRLSPHLITYHNDVFVPKVVDGYKIPSLGGEFIERFNEKITIPLLDSCDRVIATTSSYALTSPLLSRFMEKIEVIPNAVDTQRFRPGEIERETIVLYVGRLIEYKGVEILLKAMRTVQESLKEARLVIIGDGEDRERLEILSKKLDVKVEFKGELPDEDVAKWMKKARVLVLPSFSRLEAFGIVLLEAMASATPVIGSNIPGVRDVAIEGGLTFSDINDLAEKVINILTNDKLAEKLSRKGLKAVREKYSWEVVSKKIEKLYFSLI
jgi:glycosyltransferase involved in cell wall biosynthesis